MKITMAKKSSWREIVPPPNPTKTGPKADWKDRLNPFERGSERIKHNRQIKDWYKSVLDQQADTKSQQSGKPAVRKYSQFQYSRPWGVRSSSKKNMHKLKHPNVLVRAARRSVVWAAWIWGAGLVLPPVVHALSNDRDLESQPSDKSYGRPQQLAENDSITGSTEEPVLDHEGNLVPEAEGLTAQEWRERLLEGNEEAIAAHGFETKERALTDLATDNASRLLNEEGTNLHEVVRASKFTRNDPTSPNYDPADVGYPLPASLGDMITNSGEVEVFTDVHWEVAGSGEAAGKIIQVGRRVLTAEIAQVSDESATLVGWESTPNNQAQAVIASPYRIGYRDGQFVVVDDVSSDRNPLQYRKGSANPIMQTGIGVTPSGDYVTDRSEISDQDSVIVAYVVVSQANGETVNGEYFAEFDGERWPDGSRRPDARGGVIPITVPAAVLRNDEGQIVPSLYKADGNLQPAQVRWDLLIEPGTQILRQNPRYADVHEDLQVMLDSRFGNHGQIPLTSEGAVATAGGAKSFDEMLKGALEGSRYLPPPVRADNGMRLASGGGQRPVIRQDTAILEGPYQGIYTAEWDSVRPGYESAREATPVRAASAHAPSATDIPIARTPFDPAHRGNSWSRNVSQSVDGPGIDV